MEKSTSANVCLQKIKSSILCQSDPYEPRGTHFFVNLWDTRGQFFSRPAARNVQHYCRGSEHNHTGKSLLLNMHCIRHLVQLSSNFIYLLCYPIYEAKKFYENLIRPNAVPKGKCSEPRVGIVLCVQLMTLFSLAATRR